ncbi:hypothetical protein EG328_003055 [Venturia inaequalis]|uniref:Uncharacterized protein n=1 Tax=Venturia inaequalis TaxID=5025 RepID=A0A8H3VF49_VENIN|nr:hypothetical protein EG327_005415 [Venturia inaequalis]KAE9987331.1 hypothetical protein EG328_003055 [Venturia inaequalis]
MACFRGSRMTTCEFAIEETGMQKLDKAILYSDHSVEEPGSTATWLARWESREEVQVDQSRQSSGDSQFMDLDIEPRDTKIKVKNFFSIDPEAAISSRISNVEQRGFAGGHPPNY